jgi:hypothetical protein
MANWLVFTRADAKKFQKLLLWLFDLPKKGVNVGGGRHVTIPDTLPNPPPADVPGWTTRQYKWAAHPANDGSLTDQFAVKLTESLQTAWQAKKDQLTAQQRLWVQNNIDIASDIELLQEWKSTIYVVDGYQESVIVNEDVEPDP